MKLQIVYDKGKCIGYGSCEAIDPKHFKLVGGKAALIKGKEKNQISILEIDADLQEKQKAIEAAKNCPVNAIKIIDLESQEEIVGDKIKTEGLKTIQAKYDDEKEFALDPAGYFLIKIDRVKKLIEVGFCNGKNKMVLKITGKTPLEIYQTIINKESLPIRKDHCAYLGRELQKACLALKYNLEYVQDDELDLDKAAA